MCQFLTRHLVAPNSFCVVSKQDHLKNILNAQKDKYFITLIKCKATGNKAWEKGIGEWKTALLT